MYLSVKWLQKFLPEFELKDVSQLKEKLDTRLSEVEAIEQKGDKLKSLVVGEIVELNEHPTNKKLTVCIVNVGTEKDLTIVCGAPNARVGLKSVTCLPGGQVLLPDGEVMKITERKMGEVTSQGMLCAPDELGLSDDHTQIIELASKTTVGEDVTELFRDVVLEIENKALPHRPDAFSHLGIAREIKAIFGFEVLSNPTEESLHLEAGKIAVPLNIAINEKELCPRFSAIVLDNIKIEPSPLWMQIALSYADVRPINNVVDITNYVMMSIGQPMHAFDYDKLPQPTLTARLAKAGEKLSTLDGKERELTDQMMIVDARGKVESVAGVMGGAESEIDLKTSRIVLEAANWEMYQIRRTSRALGLRSEASTRFEKGISPTSSVEAIAKAVSLMADIASAEVASELQDLYPTPQQEVKIKFDLNSVKRLIGIEIEKTKMLKILESLGFTVIGSEKISADVLHRIEFTAEVELIVPEYRRDINIKEDVIEEIARLYGYEEVPLTLPSRDLKPPKTTKHMILSRQVKRAFSVAGLTETLTYSMVGDEIYQNSLLETTDLIGVPSAISPELAYIRSHLMPSLISKVKQNQSRYDQVGLFELTKVAFKHKGVEDLPHQPFKLSVVITGKDDTSAFRFAKRYLEILSNIVTHGALTATSRSDSNQNSFFHPGKTGDITLGKDKIGEIGVIHPLVVENFGLNGISMAGFEVNFDKLIEQPLELEQQQEISNYQPVRRDVNYWISNDSEMGTHIMTILNDTSLSEVVDVNLIDTYQDQERTRITLRYVLQSMTHTLEQEEITNLVSKLTENALKFGLEVRE